MRFKLAKIAIAFAARFYSNAENGKILLVRESHVECAIFFLSKIYGKNASGYMAYSEMKKSSEENVTPEKLKFIECYFDKWKLQKRELLKFLMNNNVFDSNGVMEHLGCVKTEAIEVISKLAIASCISKRGAFYTKTPPFVDYLKSVLVRK